MRQTKRTTQLIACAIISSSAPGAWAAEIIYDVALDFLTAANPNGVWSYGYATSLGGSLIPYTEAGNSSGLDYWQKNLSLGAPSVAHNPSTNTLDFGTPVYGPGQAGFHPGPQGQYSMFRFTAPGSGPYRLESLFFGMDEWGTTTDVHVLHNDLDIFSGTVSGFGPANAPFFNTNLMLQLGDRIDFAVGFGNGSFYNDSTGIQARLIPDLPQLVISQLGNLEIQIAWPGAYTNYFLESTDTMTAPVWSLVTNAVVVQGDSIAVTTEPSSLQRYFRLHRP